MIPYGGHDPIRRRNLDQVLAFYRYEFPEWRVRIGCDNGRPFSRALAVNNGVRSVSVPLVVVNDADSLCEPAAIRAAVKLADRRDVLVQAFTRYVKIDTEGTVVWEQDPTWNHGCVAVRRRVFLDAGGYDESYRGWGYEDLDLNLRLPLERVPGTLTHLWHEAEEPSRTNQERFLAKQG